MTTQTHTLPELDPALDFEVPCQWEKCTLTATWFGQMKCCTANGLDCEPHMRFDANPPANAKCLQCGKRITAADIRWEPIR
jgi:hypothetical protein